MATDFDWSAERWGGAETGGLILRSVALTPGTARIAARPLTWFEGELDHRHVADERWHLPTGYVRDVLTRAAAHHLDRTAAARKGNAWDALRIIDRRDTPPEVVRVRGGWLVDNELHVPQASGYHDGERPHGPLRWRPSTILRAMTDEAERREDEGGESACPIPDPWQVMAEFEVHPIRHGDVTEDAGEDG